MMKTRTTVALSASVILAGLWGLAWGGIEGSKHDFSKKPWAAGETCGACHTPHRDQPPKAAPLWDPTADLTRTFGRTATRAVSTNARERLGEQSTVPGSGTLTCLRCHDGTVAKETSRIFADLGGPEPGVPDGIKVDTAGNLYSGGGGLYIIDSKGKKQGRIVHGQPATTNVAFGSDDWKTLYFSTRSTLFSVNVKIAGVPVPAKKRSA